MRKNHDPFARQNRPGRKPLFTSRTLTSVLALGTALAAPVTNAISGNFVSNGSGVTDLVDNGNQVGGFRAAIDTGTSQGDIARYTNSFGDGAGADRIFIASPTAVINWVPYASAEAGGGAINILPNGNKLLFQADGSGVDNFTVVNRILPSAGNEGRQIGLNGLIRTFANQSGSNISSTAGPGRLWFYNAGGILVGSTANINVGGLLLTSLDPTNFAFDGSSATFTNTSSLTRGGAVQILTGAQIMASNYIGVIAPSITQSGTVTVGSPNGTTNASAAYVAAEEATININQGLFDIQVTQGTDGGTTLQDGSQLVLLHDGTTTGPAADINSPAVQQRVALVAVPKNTAITMLVQGNGKLGFDVATGVQQDRAAIILSAGHNVNLGNYSPSNPGSVFVGAPPGGTGLATISVNGSTLSTLNDPKFKNDVIGKSTGNASIFAFNGSRIDFARALNIDTTHTAYGDGISATGGNLSLSASTGGTVTVGGFTSLTSNGVGGSAFSAAEGGFGRGGIISISANGGTMALSGVAIASNGYGGAGYSTARGGNGFGGGDPNNPPTSTGAFINTNGGGSLTINGPVQIEATGIGGAGFGTDGGTGYGGRAVIFAASTQPLTIQGATTVYADGIGGDGINAGAAKGGYAQIGALNSSVTIGGNVTISATATSGVVSSPGGVTLNSLPGGFAAVGGSAVLTRDGTGTTQINGALSANASAFVDNPNPFRAVAGGGNAQGGNADIYTSGGGTINVASGFAGTANAYGGSAYAGAITGSGTGGRSSINGTAGTTVTVGGYTELAVDGYGGSTNEGDVGGNGFGGAGTTGGAYIGGGGVNITLAQFVAHANGIGGDGLFLGGNGSGGVAQISTFTNGGAINITQGARLRADGSGGSAYGQSMQVFAPTPPPTGGTGTGGLAFVGAASGSITVGPFVELIAGGAGGGGVQGGAGIGGGAQNSDTVFKGAILQAREGGQVTVNDDPQANQYGVTLAANGSGGFSSSEYGEIGNGGVGIGGSAQLQAMASSGAVTQVSVGRVFADAVGQGGDGGSANSDPVNGGNGGDGFGGFVSISGTSGGGRLIVANSATMTARGIGGFAGQGGTDGEGSGIGGTGGAGYGGSVQGGLVSGGSLTVTNGSASFGSYIVDVSGKGGDGGYGAYDGEGETYVAAGGTGGQGVGGFGNILGRGAPVTAGLVTITASGTGGNGGEGDTQGEGGAGFGGIGSAIASSRFQTTTVSTLSLGSSLTIDSSGAGGLGSTNGVAYHGRFQLQALDGATLNVGAATLVSTGASGSRPFADPFTNETGSNPVDPSNISALFGGKLNVTGAGGLTASATQSNLGLNVDGGSTLTVTNNATFQVANVVQSYRPNGTTTEGDPLPEVTSFATSGVFSANAFIFVLPTVQSINTSAILNKTSGSLTLGVPGSIKVGGLRAAGGNVTVTSQGGGALDLGMITAGGSVLLNVSPSAPTIPLTASTILTGDISAGASVLAAGPSITVGNVVSGDSIGLTATSGGVTYGTLSAGIVNPVSQSQQGYVVGINSNGAVAGGTIAARGNIGVVAKTAGIAIGDINSQQQSIILLGKGLLSTGSLTAGSTTQGVYVADAAMFGANNNSLDPTIYFAQAPTPVAANGAIPGSLVVNGTVTGRNFIAATTGSTSATAVNLSGALTLTGGSTTLGNVGAGSVSITNSGTATTGAITTTGAVAITSAGNLSVNGIAGATNIALASTGGVAQSTAALNASGNISLSGAVGANVGTLLPTGVFATADVNGGGQVSIASSAGGTQVGNVTGGLVVINTAGATNTAAITSASNISVQGSGVTVGALTARDSIGLTATSGGVNYGSLSAGIVNPVSQSQQGYVVGIRSAGAIAGGAINARGNVGAVSQTSTITTGDIGSQQSIVLLSSRAVTTGALNTASTTGGVYIANASMFTQTNGSLDPAAYFALTPVPVAGVQGAAGTITTGTVNAFRFRAASNGTFRTGNIAVGNQLDIRSLSNFILGDVSAATISLNAPGITAGALTATGEIQLLAPVAMNIGNVTAGVLTAQAGGNITIGNINAANGVFVFSNTIPQTLPNVTSPGNVVLGNINSTAGDVSIFSQRGSISTGGITAAGYVDIFADAGSVAFGNVTSFGISATAAGSITAGNITATGGEIDLEAGPDDDNLDRFVAGADITTGTLNAATEIAVTGSGNVQIASATVATPRTRDPEEFYEIGIGAGGNLTVGDVSAPGTVGLAALTGNLSAGNIVSSQDSIVALVGGNASFGSATTTGTGYVYVGNSSQLPQVDTDDGIDTSLILAVAPVRAGGTVSFAGPVSTGRFDVASANGFSAGDIAASSVRVDSGAAASFGNVVDGGAFAVTANGVGIGTLQAASVSVNAGTGAASFGNVVDSGAFAVTANGVGTGTLQAASVSVNAGTGAASFGAVATPGAFAVNSGAFTASGVTAASVQIAASGTATFNGAIVAPTIAVASNDIAIGANGSLGNASTTTLTLTNNGTGPSTLGGTAQATGYTLDASEIGRLRATQIAFNSAGNVTFNAASINAATALNGATGGFRVATPGSIRIAGNVDFTNMTATNTATFVAGQRFEIVTPTGQLRLLGSDNAVNGVANISAANVAVGSATLLDQLAVNPRFTGRDTVLGLGNSGDAVNSAGYLQAGRIAFAVGDTLLIANSGTVTAPGGFTAGTGGVTVAATQSQSNTPIDVVIYGRSLDATGTPTSSSGTVSTVVIAPDSVARISTTSSVNGCALGGSNCTAGAVVTNTVQNQLTQIAATIQSAVTGIGGAATNGPAGGSADNGGTTNNNSASDQGSDGEDDGGDDGTSAATTSAVRVNVLIDTSSIGGGGPMIDTPVTSSGNASLWGGDAGGDVGSTGAGGLGDAGGPLGDFGGPLGGGDLGGSVGAGASFGAGGTGGAGAGFTSGATGGAAGGTSTVGGNLGGAAGGSASTGGTVSGAAGGSASTGGTVSGAAGGSASAGGTASTGGTATGTSGSTSPAGGGAGGTEGSSSTAGGGANGSSASGANAEGGTGSQGGGTAAAPAGEAGAGATAATAASEGTANSGGGRGEAGASGSDAGATPGGAAGSTPGAAGSGNSGGTKDEKTDKPQGGTTGGIN